MKELSIQEKAKAYDEALEKARELYNDERTHVGMTPIHLTEIFPELKESEDERIRKALITYFQRFPYPYGGIESAGTNAKEALAWLEKQCEKKIKTPEEILGIDSDTYNKIVDECIYCEQRHTDNVEPKFHKGEWIIHQGTENVYQVVARIDNQYQLKYGDNYTIQKCADVDRCARLWDISKDAKDGDVLAWDDSKCIALFKNIYDEDSFNSYGFVGCCTGTFESRQSYHDIEGAHPATKEQRDILFQKMHESGYEWDAEKKELIKIEQKPAWSEEYEAMWAEITDLLWEGYKQSGSKFSWDDIRNWVIHKLKSIRPHKQCCNDIPSREYILNVLELGNYWKELTKGVCSTEHGTQLEYIQNHWKEGEYYDKIIVCPQKQWKPSDEQMEALKDALNDAIWQYDYKGSMIKEEVTRKHAEIIESLYNDLKKIKGE